jgi:hypothetical protein
MTVHLKGLVPLLRKSSSIAKQSGCGAAVLSDEWHARGVTGARFSVEAAIVRRRDHS